MLLTGSKLLASIVAMNLSEYIADPTRRDALAASVESSVDYLWQVATGWRGRKPSHKLALKIEQATGGKVRKETMRPDIWAVNAAPKQVKGR
jgi:DNA-binding transcriptional regulator YdaS (Cro superfamily)